MRSIPYPDPSLYQDGDFVYCDGTDAFSAVTRLVTGTGSVFRRLRDHSIPTHVGIIWTAGGQHFVAEMRPNGLEPNAPKFYRVRWGQRPRHILAVLRCPDLTNAQRVRIKKQIAQDIRLGLEYSRRDLLTFVYRQVENEPDRMYCSEYAYRLFAHPLFTRGRKTVCHEPLDPHLRSQDLDRLVSPLSLYEAQKERYQTVWKRP